jgi:uncharacterized protein YndB with AHSA1/START domain
MTNRTDYGVADPFELTIAREYAAKRKNVFRAWVEKDLLVRWWGPNGFTTPVCEMDLRPGGVFRTVVRGPNGGEYATEGVYREISPPTRLVFSVLFGGEGEPKHEAFCEVTLTESKGRTRLTIRWRHQTMADREAHEKMDFEKGWTETLERLEKVVADL